MVLAQGLRPFVLVPSCSVDINRIRLIVIPCAEREAFVVSESREAVWASALPAFQWTRLKQIAE